METTLIGQKEVPAYQLTAGSKMVFRGSEKECLEYALDHYHLSKVQFDALSDQVSTAYSMDGIALCIEDISEERTLSEWAAEKLNKLSGGATQ